MKLGERPMRRSCCWWGVLLFALLATGFYLAFDMLDLDGSDLRATSGSGVAAAELEGRFRHDPSASEAPGAPFLPPGRKGLDLHPRATTRPAGPIVAGRRWRPRARAHGRRETASPNSTLADPV